MRNFDAVDEKLAEADFFLGEIANAGTSWFRVRCYFSAFVSAARSVTFAMQASMKGVSGFDEWYAERQVEMRNDRLARFFHECRTDSQHIGFNHIVSASGGNGETRYYFGEPDPGRYVYIPDEDLLTSAHKYMCLIAGIVDRAYSDFGLEIDPDQIYTPNGLVRKGWCIEDVEEELGLPRGWTDIEYPSADVNGLRLQMLRRNIPGSGVKPLLKKYLQRELTYPCGPFRAGDVQMEPHSRQSAD